MESLIFFSSCAEREVVVVVGVMESIRACVFCSSVSKGGGGDFERKE